MSLFLQLSLLWVLAGTAPATVAEIPLTDQYGREDSLVAHRGDVAVVMVVTARRLRNLKGWERALVDRYSARPVDLLRVADVPAEPPVSLGEVAEKLRKRVPEEVPILIDLEGRWAQGFELDTSRPNLLVFDAKGVLVDSVRGRYDETLFADLCGAIDSARAQR